MNNFSFIMALLGSVLFFTGLIPSKYDIPIAVFWFKTFMILSGICVILAVLSEVIENWYTSPNTRCANSEDKPKRTRRRTKSWRW